ncbi:MAG TPA: tyrosine decarboxylase MfnA [Archaeoglobaceae archaeon]|nr:tyrosine decarboxylase MfnA [Archaeoglobaceae archaeon]
MERILEELSDVRKKDIPYSRVLSSMCTQPHPVAIEAHKMFLGTNLGDPGIFIGTKELEEKLISMLGKILHNENAVGYICSGGTEANIQAMRAARNIKKGKNVVVPKSAHFSFEKIGDTLGVEIRKAELDREYKVNVVDVERLIDDETAAITGIAGTTELGQIDPIDELSKLATEYDIPLHVDAAFGGLILPFIDEKIPFDFELDGVCSITIDPHKMGMATIPAGGVFFRDREFIDVLEIETPYLTSVSQHTLTGTRPGTGVASAYAVLRYLGIEGMKKIITECLEKTSILVDEMSEFGLSPVIEPIINVVCFECKKAEKIKEELYRRRWVISVIRNPEAIRFVVMPHIDGEVIKEFISEFRKVMKNV